MSKTTAKLIFHVTLPEDGKHERRIEELRQALSAQDVRDTTDASRDWGDLSDNMRSYSLTVDFPVSGETIDAVGVEVVLVQNQNLM